MPGAYGVVTLPIGVREGINVFLDGYIPAENLRFRETSLIFKVSEQADSVCLPFLFKFSFSDYEDFLVCRRRLRG